MKKNSDDYYRVCASVVVLRPVSACSPNECGDVYQVLLLRKPRKRDAWQLPQGGVEEGESLKQAALRELKEEADIAARFIGESDKVYQYDYPSSYRRFRPDNVCGQRIQFIFAVADPDAVVQVDDDEIDAFVWIDPKDIGKYIKRKEYLRLSMKLVEEAIGEASAL